MAAIQWINSCIDDIYLTSICDAYMGINCEINELIGFLYNNYSSVTEKDIEARRMEMIWKWLFYDPIQTIWYQTDEATAYIKYANKVVPEPERVSKAVTHIVNTAMMDHAIKDWRCIPDNIQKRRTERDEILVVTVNSPARS